VVGELRAGSDPGAPFLAMPSPDRRQRTSHDPGRPHRSDSFDRLTFGSHDDTKEVG
jgi:hypothetical protein